MTVPSARRSCSARAAARAAVWALTRAGADVSIWNRTSARAEGLGARVVTEPISADVLVNCTSVGLDRSSSPFKDLPLDADGLSEFATVADLVYKVSGTMLIAEAQQRGIETVDGLEILVCQGALSFTIWTGQAPPRDQMRAAARHGRTQAPCSPNPFH